MNGNDGGNMQMNDETWELVKRHREAAREEGIVAGIVYTGATVLIIALLFKILGVSCG
jgi:hypothetical protein